MNIAPALTAEDFKNVHNGKCEVYAVLQQLEGTVHPNLVERLKKALEQIEVGLKAAYDEEEAVTEQRSAHYEEISKEIGAASIWSLSEISDLNTPHGFELPSPYLIYSSHWGKKPVTQAILGPTWKDLYRAADASIRMSGDNHHVFIEAFTMTADGGLELSTGS